MIPFMDRTETPPEGITRIGRVAQSYVQGVKMFLRSDLELK